MLGALLQSDPVLSVRADVHFVGLDKVNLPGLLGNGALGAYGRDKPQEPEVHLWRVKREETTEKKLRKMTTFFSFHFFSRMQINWSPYSWNSALCLFKSMNNFCLKSLQCMDYINNALTSWRVKNITPLIESPLARVSSAATWNLINSNEMIFTLMKETQDDNLIS